MSNETNFFSKENQRQWLTLKEYIPTDQFRTVAGDVIDTAPGYSEIKVMIDVTDEFADSLSLYVEKIGLIIGFVHISGQLLEINQSHVHDKGVIDRIFLNDVKDRFNMSFHLKDGEEYVYYVHKEEVKELLEQCPFKSTYHQYGSYKI